jgi:hypothetical protein
LGGNANGKATPPGKANGVAGTAIDVAAGGNANGQTTPPTALREPRSTSRRAAQPTGWTCDPGVMNPVRFHRDIPCRGVNIRVSTARSLEPFWGWRN